MDDEITTGAGPQLDFDARLERHYDVLVVEAGPGGSVAAKTLASAGWSVLLLEKRQEIGAPLRCGEVVGPREVVRRFIAIDEGWAYQDIDELWFHPPNGKRFTKRLPGCGMMVDRKRFDKALAIDAAHAGAQVLTKARVTGLIRTGENGIHARIRYLGQERTIAARAIVGADGVESLVGRWAGIRKNGVGAHESLFGRTVSIGGCRKPFQRTSVLLWKRRCSGRLPLGVS